jgi:hypothetical protein
MRLTPAEVEIRGRQRRHHRALALAGRGRPSRTRPASAAGDVAGMARHARRLLSDEDLRCRMSHAARRLAETQFRLSPAVDRYEAAYRRVLGA